MLTYVITMPQTISQSGGTIAFRQIISEIQYSLNGSTWNAPVLFPVTIINTSSAGSSNILTVELASSITFNSDNYFICGSQYISFDGMNNTCTFTTINLNQTDTNYEKHIFK